MAETWRVVLASGEVLSVEVQEFTRGRWIAVCGHRETFSYATPDNALRAFLTGFAVDADVREILAPDEPTRAELLAQVAAQLATATASVRQLRADVRLATAQRDAETCRADNTEGERDSLRAQLAAVTAERDALRAEHDGEHDLIARQAAILTAVANALKGPPPALRTHSHHDLGAVAAATVAQQAPLVACVDALRSAARDAGWRDADATGDSLVAWVRRGGARKGAHEMRQRCAGFVDAHGMPMLRDAIRAIPLDAPGGAS